MDCEARFDNPGDLLKMQPVHYGDASPRQEGWDPGTTTQEVIATRIVAGPWQSARTDRDCPGINPPGGCGGQDFLRFRTVTMASRRFSSRNGLLIM